jgi:hypothetical protein
MKTFRGTLGIVGALSLLIGAYVFAYAAPSAIPAPGSQNVSPTVYGPGQIPYIYGTQSQAINVHGGTFTANSGSAVTVADSNLTANSVVVFGLKTAGGTPAAPFLVTVTPGTGFTVNSGGSDTSVYNYLILG